MSRRRFCAERAAQLIAQDSGSEPDSEDEEVNEQLSGPGFSGDVHQAEPSSSLPSSSFRRRRRRAPITNYVDEWTILDEHEQNPDNWLPVFSEYDTGFQGDLDLETASPIDVLNLFLTIDFWNLLVTETNRYAEHYINANELLPNSRFRDWRPVTVPEMKAFFSLHFAMGLVQKAEIEDYWSTYWVTQTPGFTKVMSRNRFEAILSFLHFNDNSEQGLRGTPDYDRLFKIRPLINILQPKFSALYRPKKELSVDELTIAFKGRSALKQYNKSKPDKWGYKGFAVSEASTGYLLDISLYVGKSNEDDSGMTSSHRVVRDLVSIYAGKGHEVYIDSYYSGVPLAVDLSNQGIGVCGTVNPNRVGLPSELKPSNLPLRKGDDPVFARNGKLLVCAWHDTKRVTMLSTIHTNDCVEKQIRSRQSVNGYRTISKPVCVDGYNKNMGGVDLTGQRSKTYLFPHRSRKWYQRIVNSFLSICTVNAHIIFTSNPVNSSISLKSFIQKICVSLLEGYATTAAPRGRRSSGDKPQRLIERHFLEAADARPDCAVCSNRAIERGRRQTQFKCRNCQVPLCAYPCFERYHTLLDYKLCHLYM